jgi:ribonuclease HI
MQLSIHLEFPCTNNQTEYEALLCGFECVKGAGIRDISAFGDSWLIVQQIRGESQCQDGVLNEYRERCLEIIRTMDTFCITQIPSERNERANELVQQASGYEVSKRDVPDKARADVMVYA